MDILFITPPVWDFHLPYSAVPHLMGACKNAGLDCAQLDLGVTAFTICFNRIWKEKSERLLSEEYYNRRVATWKDSPVTTYSEYLEKISFFNDDNFSLAKAKEIFSKGGVLEKSLVEIIVEDVQKELTDTHKFEAINVADYLENPTSGLMNECIEKDNLTALLKSDIMLVGISMTSMMQYRYIKELICTIKSINPSAKFVLGGAAILSATRYNTEVNVNTLLKYVDFLSVGDGEVSIVRLVHCLKENSKDFSKVPGLIYKTSDNDFAINPQEPFEIESVPIPCFDGVDFNRYFLPEPMFPYQTSRGCFYGECAFCNAEPEYRHNFRVKSVGKVIAEIITIVEQTGVRNIQFCDEAIEPNYFKELVTAMEEHPDFHDISWLCYLRVSGVYDEETVRLAAKNGCRMVMLGVETFQQRLLKLIKKGTSAQTAVENLKLFHTSGIRTQIWLMYGMPSETIEEALNDAEIIKETSKYIDAMTMSAFSLTPSTDMFRDPEKYNILTYDEKAGLCFTTHNQNIPVDVEKVREAYLSKMEPFRNENYFYNKRFVTYYR